MVVVSHFDIFKTNQFDCNTWLYKVIYRCDYIPIMGRLRWIRVHSDSTVCLYSSQYVRADAFFLKNKNKKLFISMKSYVSQTYRKGGLQMISIEEIPSYSAKLRNGFKYIYFIYYN